MKEENGELEIIFSAKSYSLYLDRYEAFDLSQSLILKQRDELLSLLENHLESNNSTDTQSNFSILNIEQLFLDVSNCFGELIDVKKEKGKKEEERKKERKIFYIFFFKIFNI